MKTRAIRLGAAALTALSLAGLAVPAQAAGTDTCGPVIDWVKYCSGPDGSPYPVLVSSAAAGPRPVIAGALLVANTLTVVDGVWNPAGATLTHQWVRNDVPILGATGASYTLTKADLGKYVRVTTTATAPGYAKTTVWSAKGASVTNAPGAIPTLFPARVNVEAVGIEPGDVSTPIVIARPESWIHWGAQNVQFQYQWLRSGAAIPGATTERFDTTGWSSDDALSVRVTAYATGYDSVTVTSQPQAWFPSNPIPGAVVTGSTGLGDVLTGTDDVPWRDYIPRGGTRAAHSYKWLRDGVAIPGSTSLTYAITAADQGHTLVLMTDTSQNDAYSNAVAVPAAAVELKRLVNVAPPVLTGTAATGTAMTVTAGTWSVPAKNLTVTYNWLSLDGKVSATGPTFTPDRTHAGVTVTVLVTVSAPGYAPARTRVTAPKPVTVSDPVQKTPGSITGALMVGAYAWGDVGTWSDVPPGLGFSLQWLRNGVPIEGATIAKYHLAPEDFGKTISLKITTTLNGRVLKVQTVDAAAKIAPAALRASTPTIAGTAKAGSVLTAKPGSWTRGTTFKYRWLRNGVPISGATASTYKVRTSDRDKRIVVNVTGSRLGYTTVTKGSGPYFAR